jgi:hypothetical protein
MNFSTAVKQGDQVMCKSRIALQLTGLWVMLTLSTRIIHAAPATAGVCGRFVTVSPENIDFGALDIGSEMFRSITITNHGDLEALVTWELVDPRGDFGVFYPCFGPIPGHGACNTGVVFAGYSEELITNTLRISVSPLNCEPYEPYVIDIPLSGRGKCKFDSTNVIVNSVEDGGPYGGVEAAFYSGRVPVLDYATICGYNHFNWLQTVLRDPLNYVLDPPQPIVPYVDPPLYPHRGSSFFRGDYLDGRLFYWNEELPRKTEGPAHILDHTGSDWVYFFDKPARPLPGQGGDNRVEFRTRLVGVRPDGSYDSLFAFDWAVTFFGIDLYSRKVESAGSILLYIEIVDPTRVDPRERQLLVGCANCGLFSDGFESGDTSNWSLTAVIE